MFWHVYDRSRRCPDLKQIYLATDDRRILDAAKSHGVPVLMTRSDHPSGSDRVMEAAEQLSLNAETVVVNIQGDEPLLDPAMLGELVKPFGDPQIQVTTMAHPLTPEEAALITFAEDNGDLQLSLRSPNEQGKRRLEVASWETLSDYVKQNQGTDLIVPKKEKKAKKSEGVSFEVEEEDKAFIQIFRGGKEL